MNESLLKSYEIILHQQEKMDNKAYIFIGFITLLFTYINNEFATLKYSSFLLLVICIPLINSLIPKASLKKTENIRIKKDKPDKHYSEDIKLNIFYYLDIYNKDYATFKELYEKVYKSKLDNPFDQHMVYQLIINAKILRIKVEMHELAERVALVVITLFFILNLCIS